MLRQARDEGAVDEVERAAEGLEHPDRVAVDDGRDGLGLLAATTAGMLSDEAGRRVPGP